MSLEQPHLTTGTQSAVHRCSLVTTAILGAYFAIAALAFVVTLSDTKSFITATGGNYCWVYRDLLTYAAYNILELISIAIITYVMWHFRRTIRCWASVTTCCGVFFALILLRYINGCG